MKENKMKYCLYVLCFIFLLTGCAYRDVSVCRHNAVNSAILHKAENRGDEVMICLGWSERGQSWHAQAKYRKPGGKWIFLRVPTSFTNFNSEQDDFEIMADFSIDEWLKRYLKIYK